MTLEFFYTSFIHSLMQDSLDQCRSMPIKIMALIPMLINSDQCRSMPINSDQFLSMPINARSSRIDPALISIDRHWSAMIGIDRHWYQLILVGIDRHWSKFIGVSDQCHNFVPKNPLVAAPDHALWWKLNVLAMQCCRHLLCIDSFY